MKVINTGKRQLWKSFKLVRFIVTSVSEWHLQKREAKVMIEGGFCSSASSSWQLGHLSPWELLFTLGLIQQTWGLLPVIVIWRKFRLSATSVSSFILSQLSHRSLVSIFAMMCWQSGAFTCWVWCDNCQQPNLFPGQLFLLPDKKPEHTVT
jgi:hypothetical protein